MLTCEGTLRRFQERQQQAIFAFGQGNRIPLGIEQTSAAAFQTPPVKSVSAPFGIMGTRGASHLVSPQNRANAREQFPETERLGDVIVGTELEADDTVNFITAMPRRDDDRNVRVGANLPQEIQPVILAEPEIQNDQARIRPREVAAQFASTGHSASWHIVLLEVAGHHLPHRRGIVHNKDMARFSWVIAPALAAPAGSP